MKRINLSVNLEDNEILEQSILIAIHAQAKQIAREEFTKTLEAEIERIANGRIEVLKNAPYYNDIINRITKFTVEKFNREIHIDPNMVNDIVERKVNEYLDVKLRSRNGLDEFIQNYIDKSIATALLQRANGTV
jgi:RNase adaptor protein for sRNA GlmZ degradation